MTLFLGLIAAFLLILLIGVVARSSSHQGEVLAFTSPDDLNAASMAAAAPITTSPRNATSRPIAAATPPATSTSNDFYPGNLGIGTAITYRGETSEIVGVISFEFDGEIWQDYLMSMKGGRWWRLGVEPDRNMKLVAFAPTTSQVEPGPAQITHDGHIYTMTESGPANYRSVGQTSRFEKGTYWFFDYRNDANQVLNFERFDSSPWVVSIGRHIPASELQISNFADEPNW